MPRSKRIDKAVYEAHYPLLHETDTSVSFLSLPLEIRYQIYTLALVSSTPIVVWKGRSEYQPSTPVAANEDIASFCNDHVYTWCRIIDHLATEISLCCLSINLLFCSKSISKEAASVFYSKNIFSFLGEHEWDPVVSWLQTMGPQNRNQLTSIAIDAYKPDEVWQRFTGERVRRPGDLTKNVVYPRNVHLGVRIRPLKYGLVDNINPALEMVFELLGQRTASKSVLVALVLVGEYPGQASRIMEGDQDDQCPESGWFSMDLPNLIEKFRVLHTVSLEALPKVEVVWKGKCKPWLHYVDGVMMSQVVFLDHLTNIEIQGWDVEILGMRDDDTVVKIYDEDNINVPTYVLKRRKLLRPLIGEDPNPYSGIYIRQGSEEWWMEEVTGWYSGYY